MTFQRSIACPPHRQDRHLRWSDDRGGRWSRPRFFGPIALLSVLTTLEGCISVNAPDKPIVIELNINIKQEVIYRLAEDVKQNIDANPDIF